MIEVTGVRHIQDYKLRLEFSDGTSGSVDLEHDLEWEVFGPLKLNFQKKKQKKVRQRGLFCHFFACRF